MSTRSSRKSGPFSIDRHPAEPRQLRGLLLTARFFVVLRETALVPTSVQPLKKRKVPYLEHEQHDRREDHTGNQLTATDKYP
jgi:hypothetical protein